MSFKAIHENKFIDIAKSSPSHKLLTSQICLKAIHKNKFIDIAKSSPSHKLLTPQICFLKLFTKISLLI